MKILLLGASDLIGKEIGQTLLAAGVELVGAARNADLGHRLLPGAEWVSLVSIAQNNQAIGSRT